ncbi:MAG: DUF2285 domain-containing protein [Sphingobium sp.]|nr:DUF2285 domain-containing protein [Sphingomonas sp.]HPR08521.1 DUF2285 domain-containing protein [Denitromonas sp.]
MSQPDFMDRPPQSDSVTAYDEAHFVTYLRLLDAAAEGADWEEVAELVLGIDPVIDSKRARTMYDSHLARANWMARTGYSQVRS